jgi:hypothetical protein
MLPSRLACLAVALLALGAARCGGSKPGHADGGNAGTGGTGAAGGGGAGAAGGSGGAAGGTGGAGGAGGSATGGSGAGGAGAGGGGNDGPAADTLPSDAVYDTPPVPGNIPLGQATAVFAAVACEKVFACCTDAERARNPLAGSQAGCEIAFGLALGSLMGQASAAITAGTAMYDPAALADCLTRYRAQSCEQVRAAGGLSAYRMCNFIKPLVAAGGTCTQHLECVAGYCAPGSTPQSGTCTAKLAEGQPCTFADQCQGGACRAAGSSVTCATAAPDGLCSVL